MTPFIVDVQEIMIRPQTDTLRPITTVTKDGIENTFNDIQVVYRDISPSLWRFLAKHMDKLQDSSA